MLNPQGTYCYYSKVEQFECDLRDRMKLSWLMRRQQQGGEEQLLSLGMGYQKLFDEGMVFLISKIVGEIIQMPRYQQEIAVMTCPLPPRSATFLRETRVEDRSTGRLLSRMVTAWMLVNPVDRRILRPSAFPYQMVMGEFTDDPSIFRFRAPQGEPVGGRTVGYSDLDINGHVNNAVYGDIAEDFLPLEVVQQQELAGFAFHYQNEALAGDRLTICRAQPQEQEWFVTGDGPQQRCFEARRTFR